MRKNSHYHYLFTNPNKLSNPILHSISSLLVLRLVLDWALLTLVLEQVEDLVGFLKFRQRLFFLNRTASRFLILFFCHVPLIAQLNQLLLNFPLGACLVQSLWRLPYQFQLHLYVLLARLVEFLVTVQYGLYFLVTLMR